jgi:hypothetical protein
LAGTDQPKESDVARLRTQLAETNDRADRLENALEIAQENMARLELAMDNEGWSSMLAGSESEFSREGLRKSATLARVMAVANPLIKRALGVRCGYIFGEGYEIKSSNEEVDKVIQRMVCDDSNQRAVFGETATEENERTFGTDGNLTFAFFPNPRTGHVKIRTVAFDEIEDVICNPEDKDDPWFYLRQYDRTTITPTGPTVVERVREYHPALNHRPARKIRKIGNDKVVWDVPYLHVKVNALDGWKFGIGDAYAALPWARLYRDFLGDWAVLVKALSQFAFKVSGGSAGKADQLRQAIARATRDGVPVGSTAALDAGTTMEAIPKTGATIDSESGKPLAAMVAASLGIPVTVLLGDPGQTGARAVAETLDTPTVNEMQRRRRVWDYVFRQMATYAVRWAVIAPEGGLNGTIKRNTWTDEEEITLRGAAEYSVDIIWPSLADTSTAAAIQAIVNADATGKMPPLITLRLMLEALKVPNVEDILNEFKDLFTDWDPMAPPVTASVGDRDNTLRDGKNDGSDSEKTPAQRQGDS